MFKPTLKALIGSSAMVSAVVMFSADADAGGKRRGSAFSGSPVIMKTVKTDTRRTAIKKRLTGKLGVPAQSAGSSNWHADWMAGVCNSAGGGASNGSDGKVHCTDPDGNEVLDPANPPSDLSPTSKVNSGGIDKTPTGRAIVSALRACIRCARPPLLSGGGK